MSDNYQAVYDAVRSRINPCNTQDILETAAREAFDISWQKQHLQQEIYAVSHEMQRPSVLYRPQIMADGTMWCVLLGDNLQEGVSGFGKTPAEAMAAFDQAFLTGLTPKGARLGREEGGNDVGS